MNDEMTRKPPPGPATAAKRRQGIRNRVLVIYTVKCAEFVAQQIVAKSGSTNVELLGFDGCTDNSMR